MFTEDFDGFLNTTDFGKSATYTPAGGSASTINVILTNEFFEVATDGKLNFESAQPMAQTKTSNVSSAKHNDTLVVDSITYKIKGIQPDGEGMTILLLEKQ